MFWQIISSDLCMQTVIYLMRCSEIAAGSDISIVCENLGDGNILRRLHLVTQEKSKFWGLMEYYFIFGVTLTLLSD